MICKLNQKIIWWIDSDGNTRTYGISQILYEKKYKFERLNKFKKIIYKKIWQELNDKYPEFLL